MKKTLIAVIIIYYSAFSLKAQPDPCNEPAPVSCTLTYNETKEYVSNYLKYHSLYWESYTRAYYVNSKTFTFLSDFFAANAGYTGLHFYFVVYLNKPNTEQANQYQSLLYCVP